MINFQRYFLILLLGLSLFGVFNLVNPHNGEFGDQATENIFFLETFDEYFNKSRDITYQDFLIEKNQYSYSEYLDEVSLKKLGLDPISPASLRWEPEWVKALPRMLNYSIYRILGKKLEINQIFSVVSYLLFFLTFFYAYKVGRVLINEKFAVILSTVFVSNFYFNQLLHSSMEPQLNVYPVLLVMGMYAISKPLFDGSYKLINSSMFFGLVFGLGILNGYPNTQLILPIFLIGYLFISNIKNFKSTFFEKTSFLLLSIIFGIIIYSIFAIIYSLSLGERPLMHHEMFFIRLKTVLSGTAFSNPLDGSLLNWAGDTFSKIWILLSTGNRYVHAPHQSGMLLNMPYLNILELIALFVGIGATFFVKKISISRPFLLFVLAFFLVRAFAHDNSLVNKASFDSFLVLMFPVAFGIYYLATNGYRRVVFTLLSFYRNIITYAFNLKIKGNIVLTVDNLKGSMVVSIILLALSSSINAFAFNNKYLMDYDASLAQFSGMVEVRKYLKNYASDSSLVIFNHSHGLDNTLYRMNFMEGKRHYMNVSDWHDVFPSVESMADTIKNDVYKNIIIIERATNFRYGKRVENLGYVYKQPGTNRFYSFLNPTKTIVNYAGMPTYWIYQIDKDNLNSNLEIPAYSSMGGLEKLTLNFDLSGKKLKGLSLPGNMVEVSVLCNGEEILDLTNNDSSYDYIHINSDGTFTAVKYVNWNFGYGGGPKVVSNNNGILMNDGGMNSRLMVTSSSFFVSDNISEAAELSVSLNLGLPIDKVIFSVPYVLYNDHRKTNNINVGISAVNSDGEVIE